MLTAEDKKKYVTALISLPLETMDQVTVQKQLHELLLHDTVGGKLYKYRAFDSKGYSLKNLESGTLHCSSSAAFNDPFDPEDISITLSEILKVIMDLSWLKNFYADFIAQSYEQRAEITINGIKKKFAACKIFQVRYR